MRSGCAARIVKNPIRTTSCTVHTFPLYQPTLHSNQDAAMVRRSIVRCSSLSINQHSLATKMLQWSAGRLYGARLRQPFALEDAVRSHACWLEALAYVCPMAFLVGVHCLFNVITVNSVQTLKGFVTAITWARDGPVRVFDRNPPSRMPLVPTHARVKFACL
jgi:hypothetical protein